MKPRRVHRVAIVGMGLMGRRHARVMTELAHPEARFELVGVVDADAARASAASRAWGAPAFEDEAEAIARAELVLIATPIATHAALAMAALEAGRHVFVEKPVCSDFAEAQTLIAAAGRLRRQLFVGHSERFNPVVRALARLLRDDDVVAIELHRIGAGRSVASVAGLAGSAIDEPGVLLNLGVHDFDLASYLTGAHAEVRDAVGRPLASLLVDRATPEDLAHVLIGTPSGAVGHVYVDRTARARHRTVRVTTRRWIYDGDLLAHRLVRTDRATGAETDVPLLADEPLVAQATALADALDGTSSREIATGADGARAIAMAEDAARRIHDRAAHVPERRLASAEKL